MSSIDQPFSVLDESVLAAMEVRHQPYDYAFVENVAPARLKEEILADAPVIPHRGTYGIPNLRYGPKFDAVIKDLLNEYPYERGRLRILRSDNRDDYAFEYAPEYGKMCLFKVSDKSWHGFLPQKSERMSLQFCWVDSRSYATKTYAWHALSAFAKATPGFNKLLEYVPRNWKKVLTRQ